MATKYSVPNNQINNWIRYNELFIKGASRTSIEDTEFTNLKSTLSNYLISASDWNTISQNVYDANMYASDGGGDDTYVLNLSTTLAEGARVRMKVTTGNTGACTLSIDNGTTTKDIKKMVNGSPVSLDTGDIQANSINTFDYDGTQWLLFYGVKGTNGTNGIDGSVWYEGAGTPSTLHNDNDFYLNTTNGDVYKQVSSSWGSPVGNIKGATGATGAAGSVWRNGSGAPSNGLGIDGDYYLDDATSNVYYKSTGAYSIVVNIKGATGATGSAGTPGSVWRNGSGAPSNGLGIDGDYYLDVDTSDVYYKSSSTYSIVGNIKGATGSTGATGAAGAVWRNGSGAPSDGLGINGDYYLDNATDNVYYKSGGAYSIVTNIKGTTGDTGATGAAGAVWRNGSGAPSSGLGINGDYYLDTATSNVYYKSSGTYSIVVNIKGATGATGETGATGAAGLNADMTRSSTTSNLISVASKTFTYTVSSTNLGWAIGTRLRAASNADASNYVEGLVTSVSSTQVVINVDATGGSGTKTDWNIFVVGSIGATGAQGATGSAGTNGLNADMTRTSTTSLLIEIASKTFTYTSTSSNLGWTLGTRLRAASNAGATNYMEGIVTSVSSSQVIINVDTIGGSGTKNDWNIFIAGNPASLSALTPTAIKTTNYTANANELIPCDISSAGFTITLPSAPADGTKMQIMIITMGTGTLEVACGGTDTFWKTGGVTSFYMGVNLETANLQYQSSTGVWFVDISAVSYNFATNFPGIDATTPLDNTCCVVNTSTRVLTITPPLGYFRFFVDGGGKITRYRKTTSVAFPAFTDTSGAWYFYFNSSGTAVTTQTPWTTNDFVTSCPIYRILWNSTLYKFTVSSANATLGATYTNNGKTYTVVETIAGGTTLKMSCPNGDPQASGTLTRASGTGDATITFSAFDHSYKLVAQYIEHHLNDIPADVHQWMHLQGTVWKSGFTMVNNATAGTPNADGRNTVIALTTGENVDDNLEYTVTNTASPSSPWQQDMGNVTAASLNATNSGLFKIFTQDASGNVNFLPATRFPFAWNATSNRPEVISTTGVRTVVTDNRWFVYFVYATQNPTLGEAVKVVSATTEYTSLTNARAASWVDIQNAYPTIFGSDNEIRPLYRLIFYNDNSGGGAYDAGCKYSALLETQDLRKTIVSQTTAAIGSVPATSVTTTASGRILTNAQSSLEALDTANRTFYATDTGGDDTYVATLTGYTAYTVGDLINLTVTTGNTGNATLNINGLGALNIMKMVAGVATTLGTGDIQAGSSILLSYDGTQFQLLNGFGNNVRQFYASSASVTDTYTATVYGYGAYTAGDIVVLYPSASGNTGACTLNINGLGAKNIKRYYGTVLKDLLTGDITINQPVVLQYDGTSFLLLTEAPKYPSFYSTLNEWYGSIKQILTESNTFTPVAGTVATDSTNVKFGNNAIRITENDNSAGVLSCKVTGLSLDLTKSHDGGTSPTSDKIMFTHYVSNSTKVNYSTGAGVFIKYKTDTSNYFTITQTSGVSGQWTGNLVAKSSATQTGTPDWANITEIEFGWESTASASGAYVTFDVNSLQMQRADGVSASPFMRYRNGAYAVDSVFTTSSRWVVGYESNKLVFRNVLSPVNAASWIGSEPITNKQGNVLRYTGQAKVTGDIMGLTWYNSSTDYVQVYVASNLMTLRSYVASVATDITTACTISANDLVDVSMMLNGSSITAIIRVNGGTPKELTLDTVQIVGYLALGNPIASKYTTIFSLSATNEGYASTANKVLNAFSNEIYISTPTGNVVTDVQTSLVTIDTNATTALANAAAAQSTADAAATAVALSQAQGDYARLKAWADQNVFQILPGTETWASNSWAGTTGTYAQDTTNYKTGAYGAKLTTSTNSGGIKATLTRDCSKFPDGTSVGTTDYIRIAVYPATGTVANLPTAGILLRFPCDAATTITNCYTYAIAKASLADATWFFVDVAISGLTSVGSPALANIKGVSLEINGNVGGACNITLDSLSLCIVRKDPSASSPNPFQRLINNVRTRDFAINSNTWFLGNEFGKITMRTLSATASVNTLSQTQTYGTCTMVKYSICKTANYSSGIQYYTDVNNSINLFLDNQVLYLRKREGGVETDTTNASTITLNVNDQVKLELMKNGTTMVGRLTINSSVMYEVTCETTLTTGFMCLEQRVGKYEDILNLSIGNLPNANHANFASALDTPYSVYVPTWTFSGGTPPPGGTVTSIGTYIVVGGYCFFNATYTSTDGNSVTGLTISLPVAPKNLGNTYISVDARQKINLTWYIANAYIADSASTVQFNGFQTQGDNQAVLIAVSGFYPV